MKRQSIQFCFPRMPEVTHNCQQLCPEFKPSARTCAQSHPWYIHRFASIASWSTSLNLFLTSALLPNTVSSFYSPVGWREKPLYLFLQNFKRLIGPQTVKHLKMWLILSACLDAFLNSNRCKHVLKCFAGPLIIIRKWWRRKLPPPETKQAPNGAIWEFCAHFQRFTDLVTCDLV